MLRKDEVFPSFINVKTRSILAVEEQLNRLQRSTESRILHQKVAARRDQIVIGMQVIAHTVKEMVRVFNDEHGLGIGSGGSSNGDCLGGIRKSVMKSNATAIVIIATPFFHGGGMFTKRAVHLDLPIVPLSQWYAVKMLCACCWINGQESS